jgi:hydrogenase maturation protease
MRGDDAVGCLVCDELRKEGTPGFQYSRGPVQDTRAPGPAVHRSPSPGGSSLGDSVLVLDCGNTPENYIQPVTDKDPARILVVDCCEYRAKPGEFRVFSRPEIEELSYGLLSTHTLPLTLFVEMLSLSTKATIELLGVQPQGIEFGTDLSEPVRGALPALLQFIRNWARAEAVAR